MLEDVVETGGAAGVAEAAGTGALEETSTIFFAFTVVGAALEITVTIFFFFGCCVSLSAETAGADCVAAGSRLGGEVSWKVFEAGSKRKYSDVTPEYQRSEEGS